MRNLFFSIAIVAIMGLAFTSCQNDTLNSFENGEVMNTRATAYYTVGNVAGVYNGTLDRVVMNGNEKDPVPGRQITVSANGTSAFNLYLPPFRVGNMPGTITVDAQGITLNSDGTFTATNLQGAVILTLPIIGAQNYDATLINGRFTQTATGYELQFGLDTEGNFGAITVFTAHVHFTGSK